MKITFLEVGGPQVEWAKDDLQLTAALRCTAAAGMEMVHPPENGRYVWTHKLN
jgi:hypothetical protein